MQEVTQQKEIVQPGPLLDQRGRLVQKGWARRPILAYDRRQVGVSPFRRKEWDYYCILGESGGLALTVADLGYLGLLAVSWLDLKGGSETSADAVRPLTLGRFNLPPDSEKGDFAVKAGGIDIAVERLSGKRRLRVAVDRFGKQRERLVGELELADPPQDDSIVMATPFPGNDKAFYYNRKVNCLAAQGEVSMGKRREVFTPDTHFGVLDWGRGVWTYANTWYWSSASGKVGDRLFGFNLGYGFGDTSRGSENIVFVDGVGHKLGEVRFDFSNRDFLAPWRLHSTDNDRLRLDFQPALDRSSKVNLLALKTVQHQVFGWFSGTVRLDDGEVVTIERLPGFAEEVYNRW